MAYVIYKKGNGHFVDFLDVYGWLVPEFGSLEEAREWPTKKAAEEYAQQIHVKGLKVKEVKGE